MLNLVAGVLAKDPSIKEVKKGDETLLVSNNAIYIKTQEGRADIPVNISGWGDVAKEMQNFKKGSSIHFIGSPNDSQYKNEAMQKPITTLGFTVLKIDHSKELMKEVDQLLSKYLEEGKEKKAEGPSKGQEKKAMSSGKKKTPESEMMPGAAV